jgi:hypothetical protein
MKRTQRGEKPTAARPLRVASRPALALALFHVFGIKSMQFAKRPRR